MHDYTTTTYGMPLQHGDRSPQKEATLTSNIGALRPGKRSKHQKKPALTKVNGAHLIKWLAAFCVLDCVGASEFGESPGASSTNHPAACPPQWLPVLVASSSRHDENLPFESNNEALSTKRRMASPGCMGCPDCMGCPGCIDKNTPNDPDYCQNALGTFLALITKCNLTSFIEKCEMTCGFCPPLPLVTSPPPPSPESPMPPPPEPPCRDKDPDFCKAQLTSSALKYTMCKGTTGAGADYFFENCEFSCGYCPVLPPPSPPSSPLSPSPPPPSLSPPPLTQTSQRGPTFTFSVGLDDIS